MKPREHGDSMFRNEWLKDDKFKTWVANDRTQSLVPLIFIKSRSAILGPYYNGINYEVVF